MTTSAGNRTVSLRGRIGLAAILSVVWLPVPLRAQEEDETRYLRSMNVKAGDHRGDVICVGCSVRVDGMVSGDVVAVAGDIEVSGKVQGDAVAAGGRVRLLSGASVEGEVVAIGGAVSVEGSAAAKGGSDSTPYFHIPGQRSLHPLGVLTFVGVNCAAALVCGLILRERRRKNLADAISLHPWSTVLVGMVLMALWALLWVGGSTDWRPAQVATWIAHAMAMILLLSGCTGIAWLAGRLSFPRLPSGLKLVGGALVVSVVLLIPIFGMFALVAAMVISFGAGGASGLGSEGFWIDRIRLRKPAAKQQ